MNGDLLNVLTISLFFLITIGLVIFTGLFVDWIMRFINNIKSFDIVDMEIKAIEKDKFLMKFTNPAIFYGGCLWTFLGISILILQSFLFINISGLTVIGIGLTAILYSFGIKKILEDDLSNKVLLKKIERILPKQEKESDYNTLFREKYPKMKIVLYLTLGLVLVTIILIPVSLLAGYSFIDIIGIDIVFLTAAGAFNQLFVDKYEKFILINEVDRFKTITP